MKISNKPNIVVLTSPCGCQARIARLGDTYGLGFTDGKPGRAYKTIKYYKTLDGAIRAARRWPGGNYANSIADVRM